MKQLGDIPLTDIDFGNRLREDYGDLEEFAKNIKKVGGLIHPITVVDKEVIKDKREYSSIESDTERRYLLIAGGRRTKTFLTFDIADKIPAYIYPKMLTADEIREIELVENIHRKDLTWQESAKMTAEWHRLQEKLHGKKHTSASGGHGLKETAEQVGKSKSSVKNEIDLAQALETIPELSKIKKKSEAIKVMRQMSKSHDASTRAKKAREELKEKGSDKVRQDVMDSYVLGDFFEGAEKLKPHSFDLIEIDPPYGIDLRNKKKGSKHTTLEYNEVAAENYQNFIRRTLAHCKKLIKPSGWIVMWYGIHPWHHMIAQEMQDAGFKMTEIPAIWIKNGGQTMRPKHYFGSCYEPFFYARASEKSSLNKGGSSNYLIHPKIPSEQKFHPTHKPIELMEDVIERFINKGRILVPFAGSGVTLRAAHNLGMKAIGFDLSETYKNQHDAYVGETKDLKFKL